MSGIGFGGFESALQEKYRILAQHADADSMRSAAAANLANAQAATQGPLASSHIAAARAAAAANQQQVDNEGRLIPGKVAGQRIDNMGGMLANEYLRRKIPFGLNPVTGESTYTPLSPELGGEGGGGPPPPEPDAPLPSAPSPFRPAQIGTGTDFDNPRPSPKLALGMLGKPAAPLGLPSMALSQSSAPKPTFGGFNPSAFAASSAPRPSFSSLTPLGAPPSSDARRSDFFRSQGIGMKSKPTYSSFYDRFPD